MTLPTSLRRRRSTSSGFTLIEIVLVLVIISILLAGVIATLNRGGVIGTAQTQRVKGDLQAIEAGLLTHFANAGKYPTTEQGFAYLVGNKTLKEIPVDPWKNPYQYKFPGSRSGEQYDVYSLGADGIESADDVGNWKSAPAAGE